MANVNQNEPVLLTVLIDDKDNYGYYSAQVSEGVTGSSTDRGGKTVAELMNNVLIWAGVDWVYFDEDDSLVEIRALLNELNTDDFEVRVYSSF